MDYSVRKAARAVILTPQNEVLLMRMAFPWREEDVWILPGGGIEPGEDVEAAVAREVFEETGGTDIQIVGEVWRRESFVEETRTHLKQRYFLVRAARFDAKATDLSEREMEWVREYRWWSAAALLRSDIAVEPIRIAEGLQDIIQSGLPPKPVEIDAV